MAFDQSTRNRLQKFVSDARSVLTEEFTRQLQNIYGLDPHSGEEAELATLGHLNDAQRATATLLRETLEHYTLSAPSGSLKSRKIHSLERIVREQAFTILNRLVALRMAETRGFLLESVGGEYQSKCFQLYQLLVGSSLGETGDAYRCYLSSVFDEFSPSLSLLFDRFSPQGRLFPREPALLEVLKLINDSELSHLWQEDETIGWIYQYFNSKEERKKMRDESSAPRNSRELAVRNQFFTPRYVVEFLVDNTLGRFWFNQMGGETSLKNKCQYLLCTPDEKPVASTQLRDPRSIKLLDPACGSMHFGLYAFDLFEEIYMEAWTWEVTHGLGSIEQVDGLEPLTRKYADEQSFQRDIPRLIVANNIFGVDIDPRAAQIASLALWLRAQRAWSDAGVAAKDRPLVGRGNVIAAIAPPQEEDLKTQFIAELDTRDAELFERSLSLLEGLPELGVLLRAEKLLPSIVQSVFGNQGKLFKEEDKQNWDAAERRLREALVDFSKKAKSTSQWRLFTQDALEGLRLIDLVREKFDVVVMNPPFGAVSAGAKGEISKAYPRSKNDLLAVFVERSLELLRLGGRIGAITSRTCFFLSSYMHWREEVVLAISKPEIVADLGQGVMDDAMVKAAAYVLEK